MDVSADLTELGSTPMAVVCAGAKSILDIGRTLEYLVSSVLDSPFVSHHACTRLSLTETNAISHTLGNRGGHCCDLWSDN